jgi:hypothetical protein
MNTKRKTHFIAAISMAFLCLRLHAQWADVNHRIAGRPSAVHPSGPLQERQELDYAGATSVRGNEEGDWAILSRLLERASPSYTETWDDSTCKTLQEGAYLGNGDFGVHLGGTVHSLRYYLGKNGFHAGNDLGAKMWTQHILNLAILTIEKSSGIESGNAYRVTQDLGNAEIRTDCSMAGAAVQTKAYISDSANILVLELSTNSGRSVPLQATLSVIGNAYVAKNAGKTESLAWVTKEPNADGAPFYVKGAVVAKVLGAASLLTTNDSTHSRLSFVLPANGSVVKIVLQAEHTTNAGSPLGSTQAHLNTITNAGLSALNQQHRAWWKQFWLHSYISLGDGLLQQYWYNHLFMMGSCARSGNDKIPERAPGHWGPWVRSDDMMWFSNISMNYNGQNPYYGLFSSNHVNMVDPYIQTVKYYLENTGKKRVANRWVSSEIEARMPANCRGVEFELSFTSHGTSCGGGSWVKEDGCMPTNAVFGILPIVWKWKYGRDSVFLADTCYPMMLEVANFYDDYIGQPVNGQYNVYGSAQEGASWFSANDMFSLGAIQFLYREILAASIKLGRDADRRKHWQDILNHMSPYPLEKWGNTITFKPDQNHDVMDAITYRGGTRNTGLMFTTTFDNIGCASLPAYRIATCRTLDKGNFFYPQRFSGWQDSNDFGMMFVMAVRAGYRPDRVIKAIKGWKPGLNGIVSQKSGGGIETAGIIEAINDMLLQSQDGVIRIFPNWDKTIDALFRKLRAEGAFLVDARYRASDHTVDSVQIFSEKDNTCVLQSPFGSSCIMVTRADNHQPVSTTQNEEAFTFHTIAGVTYHITQATCAPVPAGSPVITRQPENKTVAIPATATFNVSASGKNLRYQWQKNRVDIPGATLPSYTTPPTTLWEMGSAYRCVISNASGTVKTKPGILNPDETDMPDDNHASQAGYKHR